MAIKVQRRRLSFNRVAFVVLAALCVAYSVLPRATARSVLQAKPGGVDTSAVPEACVQTGLNLQSACSE